MKKLRQENPPKRVPWHKTKCPELLKADIAAGNYPSTAPKDLYVTKAEYQAFTLEEFRKRIHQEVSSESKKETRHVKKKIRAANARAVRDALYGEE